MNPGVAIAVAVFAATLMLFVIMPIVFLSNKHEWTYNTPNEWPHDGVKTFCKGSKQSPINIVTNSATLDRMGNITFEGYNLDDENPGLPLKAKRSEHKIAIEFNHKYMISGGGFDQKYIAGELHMHWGSIDRMGSEHTIDGESSSGELHIVHYSESLTGVHEAVESKQSQSLAVLGIMFSIGAENPAMEKVIALFEAATEDGHKIEEKEQFNLMDILPDTHHKFYKYSGSLTTVPCSEIVEWLVFEDTVEVSEEQAERFRNFMKSTRPGNQGEAPFGDCRPVQPLNDRTVKRNIADEK